MERRKASLDRRKFPRYHPDKKNHPVVIFKVNGNPEISLETIDISKGGLMGYTSSIEQFMGLEDNIVKLVEVSFPGQNKYQTTGKILRLQPDIIENRCYCVIEFTNLSVNKSDEIHDKPKVPKVSIKDHSDVISDPVELQTLPKKQPRRKINNDTNTQLSDDSSKDRENDKIVQSPKSNKQAVPDGVFIERLQNIHKNKDFDDENDNSQLLNSAYMAFDDVVESLTVDEKWVFYEMLDEMVYTSPNYPDKLKLAFLNICQNGMKQSSKAMGLSM